MNDFTDVGSICQNALQERPMTCQKHGKQTERSLFGRWYGCPVCSDERAKIAEQQRKEDEFKKHLDSIGLPLMYRNLSFKDWKKTEEAQVKKVGRVRQYADQLLEKNAPNLILQGNTGTGKTHLAAVATLYAARKMIRCQYITTASLMSEIRDSWDFKTRTRFESEIMEWYGRVPVLFLDEIGVGDEIKSRLDIFSNLFDRRYRKNLPTIITTNLSEQQLKAHIGDRAFDRLTQRCVWVECIWESYRQIEGRNNKTFERV